MKMLAIATVAATLAAAGVALAQEPLKSGIDGTFAPHAMPKLSGGIEGFNVDLANEIAKRLGRPLQLDAVQFSGLIPGLQAGTYDFLSAPVTVTKERAENMLFTEGYINTDYQFLVKKDTPDIKSLEELKGKTIGLNKGTIYDQWARGLTEKIGWNIESYGTTTDAVQALVSGRAYAIISGNTVAAWITKNNPALKLSYLHSTGFVFGIPVRKDNAALREKIELAIECMKKDGWLAQLHEKWFGTKPAANSPVVTIYPGSGTPGAPGYDPKPHEVTCK